MNDRGGQEERVAPPVMGTAPPHEALPARHVKMPIDLKVGRLGTYRLGWMCPTRTPRLISRTACRGSCSAQPPTTCCSACSGTR